MRWFRKKSKQYISKRQKGIYYVYDTKTKQFVWKSEDKEKNESLLQRLNRLFGSLKIKRKTNHFFKDSTVAMDSMVKYLAFSITYKRVDITIKL